MSYLVIILVMTQVFPRFFILLIMTNNLSRHFIMTQSLATKIGNKGETPPLLTIEFKPD